MRRRKLSRVGTALEIFFAIVLFVLLILLIFWYQDQLNSFKPGEKTFYYCAGMKIEVSEDARFTHSEEGIVLNDNNTKDLMESIPVMYEAEKKMMLTSNNMLMRPSEDPKVYRVNEFTEVAERNGIVTFMSDGKTAEAYSGFLYDGSDTYIFLEKTILYIGAKKVTLSPLSYARVAYRQFVEYYDSDTDSFEWIDIVDTDIKAELRNGNVLDLGKDLINRDGQDSILFSAVDTLKVLELQ